MEATEILDLLEGAGVFIEVVGDRLRLTPGSCVRPELVAAVRVRKRELVHTLLVLREAEAVVLRAEAQHTEADVTELRRLAAALERRP